MQTYILALDSGTTSNRAVLFNHEGEIAGMAQEEFEQIYPKPGWVEHNPEEIWQVQLEVARRVMRENKINASQIAAIGITNQRETTLVWNRETGEPLYNAIVWQDRRTSGHCNEMKKQGLEEFFREKTGLVIDAYFSGTKIKWILDNVEGAQKLADEGKLAFGTVDSWLIWKLTGGRKHVTDVTNASRTLLYNIHDLEWDKELTGLLSIPEGMLPEVKTSSEVYGKTEQELFGSAIDIAGIAGDQQAALFGQMCIEEGMVKNTYGTGCFVVMNTGSRPVQSKHKLLTTIAWKIGNKTHYALEGSIFIAGALVQWLRDELGIIQSSAEIESLAEKAEDNGGVYMVPGFVGLGAPHWDQYATGTLIGLSRGSGREHIARAALEAIAFQSMDVIDTMVKDSGIELSELRVDGGAAVNDLLMQIQAEAIRKKVIRPRVTETTALGAAYLAGLATGFWKDLPELKKHWQIDREFLPVEDPSKYKDYAAHWQRAVERSKGWYTEEG